MLTKYKERVIYRRLIVFCRNNRLSPDEFLYDCCEGRISNFPQWYVDYINYVRAEMRNRMKTGIYNKINVKDIWS